MGEKLDLGKLVSLPTNWIDLMKFKEFEAANPVTGDWEDTYLKYLDEVVKPWTNEIHQLFGEKSILSEFEEPSAEHFDRVKPDGSINLTCGFYVSVIKRNKLGYIPISVPIEYLTSTVNILPYLMQIQKDGNHIPLSEIINTDNKAVITETGIFVPPGEQIMVYTVEKVNMPKDYNGQATTKSKIGRRKLDTVATAGKFNKGWIGVPVLEINNRGSSSSILVELGVPIAQFDLIDASHTEGHYVGQFQDQKAGY